LRRLRLAVAALAGGMALVSGAGFIVLALYIVLDVGGRYFLGVSSGVADEMGGYALAVGSLFALAHALSAGAHVRIDVLLPHLPARLRAALDRAAMVLMALFAGTLAYALWGLALDSYDIGARSMSPLRTPLAVPQTLMALGMTLLALQAVLLVFAPPTKQPEAKPLL
jgi:TRAP-type C4-dicarboxylate transport system permease small subunit